MPRTVKEGHIHSVAKYQKIEGGLFGDFETFSKKVSQSRKGGKVSMPKKSGNLLLRNACKKISAYAPVRTRTPWVEKQACYH